MKEAKAKKPSAKGEAVQKHLKQAQVIINSLPPEPDDGPFGAELRKLKAVVNNIGKKPKPPEKESTLDTKQYAVWWLTERQATKMADLFCEDGIEMPAYVASEVQEIDEGGLSDVILVHPVLRVNELDPALRVLFDNDMIHHENNVGILVLRHDVPELDQNPRCLGRFTDLEGRLYRSKVEGHPMHPYKNSSYLIWWLTPDQANQILEACDAGLVTLKPYLNNWLVSQVRNHRFFSMEIRVEPEFGINGDDLRNLNIRPDTYREEDRVPDGIVIPYEDKKLVASLAGVVTDLTGETDLTMIDRQQRLKTNLELATSIKPDTWDQVREKMPDILKAGQEKHSRFETMDETFARLAAKKKDGSSVTLDEYSKERARLQNLADTPEDLALAMEKARPVMEAILGKWNDERELYADREAIYKDYLIWWLTDVEARNILQSAVHKPSTVPLYVLGELSPIAHSFVGGFVNVPLRLMNPPYMVDVDDLDSLGVESPDQENMRDGILFLKSDLENIHVATGIFTDIKGEQMDKPHCPAVTGRNAKKYVIWWLTDVEMNILNQGIMDGSVRLPGYLIEVMKKYTKDTKYPGIIVPECVELDMACLEEYTKPWAVNRNLNGIVVPRGDMDCINKYCGSITDIDTREVSWDDFNKTPYNADEIRSMFLSYVKDIVKYWVNLHPNDGKQAAEGAVFSTLSCLDGSSMELPGFLVIPHVQEEDNEFNADYGKRPYPVAPAELVDKAVDIGGSLHEMFYQEQPDVIHCKNHVTKKQWKDGLATQRWAYICEVMLRETPFIRDRFSLNHPGTVLGEAWRDLCIICLKNGAMFIPEDYMWLEDDYSFKWATDDEVVFENMINDLSGYVLRGHF